MLYLGSSSPCSQPTIENAVNVSHASVSKALRKLTEKGLVEERKGRVEGGKRCVKIYSSTEKGKKEAGEIEKRIGTEKLLW
ncbi:MAG: helix-turn-helix domain-containing protein [Candidatus Thermoplasmatota archaeon]|nr:helix-turn-helix domain-containing protein [Candidatus Thermoplasmatota archaeon]